MPTSEKSCAGRAQVLPLASRRDVTSSAHCRKCTGSSHGKYARSSSVPGATVSLYAVTKISSGVLAFDQTRTSSIWPLNKAKGAVSTVSAVCPISERPTAQSVRCHGYITACG
eukprot:CAMPEP_0206250020 /NCGR_PEP_ID=MMETSP0047_2-20121206/21238_1 /ASSEMBLY_ACC=CAM_ASM_000192 /TAXON_ID=195065 /ORGANISM="Chroomonas mesostigmatica_cf, Strain CCMP1168" /LENGTH=112 /DNA_ID=CAMNT_0053675819 /DNA_START=848 /DNA_END=1186 /DNA_ORIENTATION=+